MPNGNVMATLVHNKSSAFHPLTKNFINLARNTEAIHAAMNNPAQYLLTEGNVLDNPTNRFTQQEIQMVRQVREGLRRSNIQEQRINGIIRNTYPDLVDRGIINVLDQVTPHIDIANVQQVFHNDDTIMRQVALNKIEWTNLTSEGASIIRLSERPGVDYPTARRLGFQDIVYIEEFPMVIANIGYKRARDEDSLEEAELIPNETHDGQVQVYTEIFTTEAIYFSLDSQRLEQWIRRWSEAELAIYPNLPHSLSMISEVTMEHKNIRTCDETRSDSGTITNPIGHYLLTLLHTLSHSTILACSVKSGFQTNSLGEYISPGTLGFYVYVNKMYESGLGGLENLFNRDMNGVLQRIETNTIDCFHDPHCKNRLDSACHACVVLSETTCREFNSHLDRKTLHGDQNRRRPGYLNFQG